MLNSLFKKFIPTPATQPHALGYLLHPLQPTPNTIVHTVLTQGPFFQKTSKTLQNVVEGSTPPSTTSLLSLCIIVALHHIFQATATAISPQRNLRDERFCPPDLYLVVMNENPLVLDINATGRRYLERLFAVVRHHSPHTQGEHPGPWPTLWDAILGLVINVTLYIDWKWLQYSTNSPSIERLKLTLHQEADGKRPIQDKPAFWWIKF